MGLGLKREACIPPEKLEALARRARQGERIQVRVLGGYTEINAVPFNKTVSFKIDPATLDWVNKTTQRLGIPRGALLRLAVYLLREVLERGASLESGGGEG